MVNDSVCRVVIKQTKAALQKASRANSLRHVRRYLCAALFTNAGYIDHDEARWTRRPIWNFERRKGSRLLFLAEFLETHIIPERIEHGIEPE